MPLTAEMNDKCIQVFNNSDLFQYMDKSTLLEWLKTFKRESWARRRTVSAQDIQGRFHVILCGRLQMVQINEETGRMVTLFLHGPGDCFDILQLLNGRPFDGVLEARDELQLLSLPMDEAREWISDHPD